MRSAGPDIAHTASPSASDRIPVLDGWRGLCLLLVLVGHFGPRLPVDFGALGVDCFFVLSGRLMADILFVEREPLRTFFVRRFSRVWPGLAAFVLCMAAVFARVPPVFRPDFLRVSPLSVAAALTFTTNYRVLLLGETQLLDHTWSLCVEAHAYLLLGLVALLCRRRGAPSAPAVLLALTLLMSLNGVVESALAPSPYLYWRSDVRAASVLVSAWLFLVLRARGLDAPPRQAVLVAILPPLALLFYATAFPDWVHYTAGTLALALLLHALPERGREGGALGRVGRLLGSRVPVALGTLSFSVYLWQQLPYKLFQELRADGRLGAIEGVLLRPFLVLLALGLGLVSYRFVERPARRLINRRFAPIRRVRPAPPRPGQTSITTSA